MPVQKIMHEVDSQFLPRRPTGVKQDIVGTYASNSITLVWTAPLDTGCQTITSYEIQRNDGGTWVAVGSSVGAATTGVAIGLETLAG